MAEGIGFVKFFFRKRGYPFGIAHINALLVGAKMPQPLIMWAVGKFLIKLMVVKLFFSGE